jgi:hypothetical protein
MFWTSGGHSCLSLQVSLVTVVGELLGSRHEVVGERDQW